MIGRKRFKTDALRPPEWVLANNPDLVDRILVGGSLMASILAECHARGGRVESEAALATACGASRPAVRKALDRLHAAAKLRLNRQGRSTAVELVGGRVVKQMDLTNIRIMTNNPRKICGIEGYGLKVVDEVPVRVEPGEHNKRYLETKKAKLGHKL